MLLIARFTKLGKRSPPLVSGWHRDAHPTRGHKKRGGGGREPGPLPTAGALCPTMNTSLLPSAILCKTNFCGAVTPRVPSRVSCAGASCPAQPSPAQPAASRALPLHPPSLHLLFPPRDTHRAGGERDEENTCFGVPELTRSVVRVSSTGIAQPRRTFLGCSDGVSERHPQKHRGVKLSVAGKGCSSPPPQHKAPAFPGITGIYLCGQRGCLSESPGLQSGCG